LDRVGVYCCLCEVELEHGFPVGADQSSVGRPDKVRQFDCILSYLTSRIVEDEVVEVEMQNAFGWFLCRAFETAFDLAMLITAVVIFRVVIIALFYTVEKDSISTDGLTS
jgi:hypothetical protein